MNAVSLVIGYIILTLVEFMIIDIVVSTAWKAFSDFRKSRRYVRLNYWKEIESC